MDLLWFKWSKPDPNTEQCGTCKGKGKVECVATYESTWNGSVTISIKEKCITCDGSGVVPKQT